MQREEKEVDQQANVGLSPHGDRGKATAHGGDVSGH